MPEKRAGQKPIPGLGCAFIVAAVGITFAVGFLLPQLAVKHLGWQHYPKYLFLIPALASATGFLVLSFAVCNRLGIVLFVKDESESDKPDGDGGGAK